MNAPAHIPLILCVEDEEELRRDLADELIEAGYRVIEAKNGAEALEQIEEVRPDLILCDISMPQMDGYDLLRTVKARPEDYADIPFVFLTALADRQEIIAGKQQGADDYLVKPIDYDLMLATVKARLRQVSSIRVHGEDARTGETAAMLDALTGHISGGGGGGVLDMLGTGIILADGNGAIRFANAAARRIAENSRALIIGDCLSARQEDERDRLAGWIRETAEAAGERRVASLSLPREDGRRDLVLTGCALEQAGGGTALAIFLADPECPPMPSPAALTALFGLTPAEVQVALHLAGGNKPSRIAATLGVSQTTIAFHMRNIFQKTGTDRQAALVAVLLASPSFPS